MFEFVTIKDLKCNLQRDEFPVDVFNAGLLSEANYWWMRMKNEE